MRAIQSLSPSKQTNRDEQLVFINAHGAATEACGPYFIQITTSWNKNTASHKWTTISLTVEDAEQLILELKKAVEKKNQFGEREIATFQEIVTKTKAKIA